MLPQPHPVVIRVCHWINALAVILMIASGWRIYNASPLFPFRFPNEITIGGWLGGALQWHFAAMWLLVINGIVYLAYNFISGRFSYKFLPITWQELWQNLRDTFTFKLNHEDLSVYNAIQKIAYLGVMTALVVVVLSGLVVWKHVQFPTLTLLMGGYEGARLVHFFAMVGIVAFLVVHLTLVVLVPHTLAAMIGLLKVPTAKAKP